MEGEGRGALSNGISIAKAGGSLSPELEVSLVYKVSSRTARAIQINPV